MEKVGNKQVKKSVLDPLGSSEPSGASWRRRMTLREIMDTAEAADLLRLSTRTLEDMRSKRVRTNRSCSAGRDRRAAVTHTEALQAFRLEQTR